MSGAGVWTAWEGAWRNPGVTDMFWQGLGYAGVHTYQYSNDGTHKISVIHDIKILQNF